MKTKSAPYPPPALLFVSEDGVRTVASAEALDRQSPSSQSALAPTVNFRSWVYHLALALLVAAILMPLAIRATREGSPTGQHYRWLAHAFLRGKFSVDDLRPELKPAIVDKVIVNGHVYVPMGPMPAIVMIPAVLASHLIGFPPREYEELVTCLAMTGIGILLLNRLLQQLGIDQANRRWWLIALFFFGTVYFSALIIGVSWFTAHVVTTTFLLGAIVESLGRRRYWLIGLCLGAAFLTRVTAIFGLPFFLYLMWREERLNLRSLTQLMLGLLPFFGFWAFYNYARFGNCLETGYGYALVGGPLAGDSSALAQARAVGLFSVAHIPKNLYMLLLATPQPVGGFDQPVFKFPYLTPSPWGMSILITTPAFVWAFRSRLRDDRVIAAWLAVAAIAVPILTYYGVGWIQFGYRYALDFYPFLIVPTALAADRMASSDESSLTTWQRVVITICLLVNLWGAWDVLLCRFII